MTILLGVLGILLALMNSLGFILAISMNSGKGISGGNKYSRGFILFWFASNVVWILVTLQIIIF